MKTKTINIYQFNELTEEAKENAIEKYRENNEGDFDFFEDTMKDLLEHHTPFKDLKMSYSLSYSQGDGVSFKGALSLEEILEADLITKAEYKYLEKQMDEGRSLEISIEKHDSRYSHEYTMYGQIIFETYPEDHYKTVEKLQSLEERIEENLTEYAREKAREIEKIGYEEIEYINSDEYIIEQIEHNEYEYDEDGDQI
jgi:hypothetical protein